MIVKLKSGYVVRSEDGRHLGGPYLDRADAEHRLDQIERFKMRPRFRKGRKNPLGSGLGFGVLVGAGIVGAVWGIVYWRAQKSLAASGGPPGNCMLCLMPNAGTVPPGASQIVSGTYKGFPYSTYRINDTFLFGGTIVYGGTKGSDSVWSQETQAGALQSLKAFADKV